ncbi:NAD(P)-dependent oxidoreductase [Andreprevotia chitinilytica]|uniref:NAD(P)-dependent oxidoreductase n=1 Tax=Andreprevotia chitinilytica TaxID=396808 RepID=UPI00055780D8|nr:NAD(P)H-binding protein [Andreprevotia chitinilytica]
MKIALVAATGNIGSHIAQQALKRGHEVTAIVRSNKPLPDNLHGVRPVLASLDDQAALVEAIRGHDVLASAFGPGSADASAVVDAAKALVAAARAAGVRRLVVVGGAGSLEVAPGLQLVDAPNFPPQYKAYALAHRDALAVLKAADDLDWTFFAPAAEIGPGEQRGTFRTGANSLISSADGHSQISYGDYADAFVAEIEQPKFVKQIATVAY